MAPSKLTLAVVFWLTIVSVAYSFTVTPKNSVARVQLTSSCSFPLSMSGEDADTTTTAASAEDAEKPAVKCPDCDLCDGSGRILGGIAVVLPWWPIKAYRPCPNFIKAGGQYVRSGQPLDEIAFGRDSSFNPSSNRD